AIGSTNEKGAESRQSLDSQIISHLKVPNGIDPKGQN
ncbi:MAG: hypothetical protein RLZZ318_183, partial [Bacteroidota bacterium]